MVNNRIQQGVSLLELMIAIAILAIILFLGVPSFQSFFESSRARAMTNDMAAALQLARSEAIKRRQPVFVCVRDNDPSIEDACGADNTNWNTGWMVYYFDKDDNDDFTPIRIWDPISTNLGGNGLTAPAAGISFLSTGRASQSANFTVDVSNNERCISVALTGRVSVRQGVCP